MSEAYDAIYLSPHLDDAALSCGGQIAARGRRGERVLILTLFAGREPEPPHSDLVRTLHALFGLDEGVIEHRRQEDLTACARLGAEVRHVDLPEAIYRRNDETVTGGYLYTSLGALFAPPQDADRSTLESLARRLADLPKKARILAPLGVGGHVDHRLVRSAAELACDGLAFYEEIPYAEKWLALRRARGPRRDWRSEIVPLEPSDVDAKVAACLAYSSQIEGLYRTPERLESALRRRVAKLGGERLWSRR